LDFGRIIFLDTSFIMYLTGVVPTDFRSIRKANVILVKEKKKQTTKLMCFICAVFDF